MRAQSTRSDQANRILDDATIAELRQINEGNMPHRATVTVVPISGTRVGGALVDRTPEIILDRVPCRLTPHNESAVVVAGAQARAVGRWTLTFVACTQIPQNAVADVYDAQDNAIARVRIGQRSSSRSFEIGSAYACEDVSPGQR
jgi:hypothetical protein